MCAGGGYAKDLGPSCRPYARLRMRHGAVQRGRGSGNNCRGMAAGSVGTCCEIDLRTCKLVKREWKANQTHALDNLLNLTTKRIIQIMSACGGGRLSQIPNAKAHANSADVAEAAGPRTREHSERRKALKNIATEAAGSLVSC